MLKASGDVGVDWLIDLYNSVIRVRKVAEDWWRSILVPVCKGKCDPLECGSYREIKLLEHGMKVFERVLENKTREQMKADDMQFGFTHGKVQMPFSHSDKFKGSLEQKIRGCIMHSSIWTFDRVTELQGKSLGGL